MTREKKIKAYFLALILKLMLFQGYLKKVWSLDKKVIYQKRLFKKKRNEKQNWTIVVSNTVVSVQYYGITGCGVFKRGYEIRDTFA